MMSAMSTSHTGNARAHSIVDFAHLMPSPTLLRAFFRNSAAYRGYWEHFAHSLPASLGIDRQEYLARLRNSTETAFADWLAESLSAGFQLTEYVRRMRSVGVQHALIGASDESVAGESMLEHVSELQRLTDGWAVAGLGIRPDDARRNSQLLDRAIRELDLRFVVASPFRHSSRIVDDHWAPVLRWCEEHDTPFIVHTGQFWLADRPYDLEHPRYLDAVARQFPRLRIVAAHAGWPWVPDMVAIAWKHRNVWIDTSAHRPKNFPRPGSGFEMLYGRLFGTFMDRVLFGSTAQIIGSSIATLRDEVLGLDIPDEAKRRWLAGNALEFFPDLFRAGTQA